MEVIRFDSIVDEDVFFMKIDIEGYEVNVFVGVKNFFFEYRVYYILVEVK